MLRLLTMLAHSGGSICNLSESGNASGMKDLGLRRGFFSAFEATPQHFSSGDRLK